MTAIPTGIVTFLLTDIEGSTSRWEREPDAMAAAVHRQYAIVDEIVAVHGGARPQEQGEGDSTVSAFANPADAVATAVDVQLALAREVWPTETPLRVRAAMHSGEVWLRNERNYFGPVIIRTARLRAAAHGGQTLVSGTVRDATVDSLPPDVTLLDLGSHRLRDLGRPEQVYQVVHPLLPAVYPPLKSLDASPNNLPVLASSLIGRESEIREVRALVGPYRLVTITGSSGAGKTRLALQVAADLGDQFTDGVWLVDLTAAQADTVAEVAAAALGAREDARASVLDALADAIGSRSMLLLVDNCEHVVDAAASLADELLRRCPGLALIATSQRPLGVAGEQQWRVPPLALPAAGDVRPTDVVSSAAARLFVERATRVRPSFVLDEHNTPAVVEICRRLDGIPLAIELAAARVNVLAPAQIAAGLDDRFRMLGAGPRTDAARHQTLLASVEWSHQLLADDERVMLRRLSMFAGSFDLDAATAVAADEGQSTWDVLDVVGRLVDSSLVAGVDHGDQVRYRLLETLRQFGRDQLEAAGEASALRARLVEWATALAVEGVAGIEGSAQAGWLERLETEHDNLRGALVAAGQESDPRVQGRLVASLARFWALHAHYEEGRRWLGVVRARGVPTALAATLARVEAVILNSAGLHDRARARAEEAVALAAETGDPGIEARALGVLGAIGVRTEPDANRPLLERAAELGRAVGDRWCVAEAMLALGHSYAVQEEHAAARPLLDETAALAGELGNDFLRSWVDSGRAWGAWRFGDFDAALRFGRSVMDVGRNLNELGAEAYGTRWLALTEAALGEPADGIARLDDLIAATTRAGAAGLAEVVATARSYVALAAGDCDRVEPPDGTRPDRERGVMFAFGEWVWGEAALARGDVDEADAAVGRLVALADRLGSRSWRASALLLEAKVARARGDDAIALDRARAALDLRATLGERPGRVDVLETLAALTAGSESAAFRAEAESERTALRYVARLP